MRSRRAIALARLVLFVSLPLPAIVLSCATSDDTSAGPDNVIYGDSGTGDASDAPADHPQKDSTSGTDSGGNDGNVVNEAGDTGTDSGSGVDSGTDAGGDADADAASPGCTPPTVNNDGGFAGCGAVDGGCPILVSDTAGTVFAMDANGTVMATYSAPVGGLIGVDHDKLDTGFWASNGTADLAHVSWSGTVLSCLSFPDANGTALGLSYTLTGLIESLNLIIVDTTQDREARANITLPLGGGTATFYLSSNSLDGGARQFWGHTVDPSHNEWVSRNAGAQASIEQLGGTPSFNLPAGVVAHGIAAKGTNFLVVDSAHKQLVEVTSTGSQVKTIALPGTNPADVSYR
jgi:hypothetical protein